MIADTRRSCLAPSDQTAPTRKGESQIPNVSIPLPRPLIRVQAAARILDITDQRLYELIRLGLIDAVKLGRQVRIDPNVLEAFIAAKGKGLPAERAI